MDSGSFIVYIKTKNLYVDTTKGVETRFGTSNYKFDRPLPKEKIKKNIRLMKDELCGKIMTEFAALRPKTCSYLTDDSDENKKVCHKSKTYCKHCFEAFHFENITTI